ncbi:hypothetical protein B1812_05505 [Methylocystis bryophila]|uniref:DUF1190 domain-containing protein n=2 Tax=Methylocystis bryophila TaxID=655015 RepID=A0A1W6MSW3_9HYPH|nr:hypothetical protein B1812_05505 [Methylocystis bryophila]
MTIPILCPIESSAQALRGPSGSVYLNAAACVAKGGRSPQLCGNAEKNAAAEFEEKAPRFETRAACERALRQPCALGYNGRGAWEGHRHGIYFTPRQDGFRIIESSGRDATVTPVAGSLAFQPRSATRLEVSISPQASRYWNWANRAAGPAGDFGVSSPDSPKGVIPPPPAVDPNFDCAAVLEPSARASAATACVLAPARRR